MLYRSLYRSVSRLLERSNVTPFSTWNSSPCEKTSNINYHKTCLARSPPPPRAPAPSSDPSYTTTFRRGYIHRSQPHRPGKGRNNNNMRGIIVTSAATAAACCCLAAAAAAAAGSSGSSGMFGIAGGRRNLASSFAGLDARGGAVGERVIFRYNSPRPHDVVVCFSKLRLFRW